MLLDVPLGSNLIKLRSLTLNRLTTSVSRWLLGGVMLGLLFGGPSVHAQTNTTPTDSPSPSSASVPKATDADMTRFKTIVDRIKTSNKLPSNLLSTLKFQEEDSLNAATDGETMFFTTPLWYALKTDDERAFVIGHELSHVTLGHVQKTQLRRVGYTILDKAVLSRIFKGGRISNAVETVGIDLLELKFSRGQEYGADDLGLRYMAKAGYNPEAAIGVFKVLDAAGSGAGVPTFLRSHPMSRDRVARLAKNYQLSLR